MREDSFSCSPYLEKARLPVADDPIQHAAPRSDQHLMYIHSVSRAGVAHKNAYLLR